MNPHGAVAAAVKNGSLVRQACEVCGDPKTEGHHTDYTEALKVVWLCKKHHVREHARLKAAGIKIQGRDVVFKSVYFLRLPEPLRKAVEKLAAREYQSLSTTLRMLIREALTARNGK
jgi:hypothetical protein